MLSGGGNLRCDEEKLWSLGDDEAENLGPLTLDTRGIRPAEALVE